MDYVKLPDCAPGVHPTTMAAIVRAESSFNPLAIGVNGSKPPPIRSKASTKQEAVKQAKDLLAQGYNIDLGLGQINSANLGWLGLTVEQAFEPCTNIRAAARVLTENYQRALKQYDNQQEALRAALSAYNTGNFQNGLTNGYVARVVASAAHVVPAIGGEVAAPEAAPTLQNNVFRPSREDEFLRAQKPQTQDDGAASVPAEQPEVEEASPPASSVFEEQPDARSRAMVF